MNATHKPPNKNTSLPAEVSGEIRRGSRLAGDDFNDEQLVRWFEQEREAFYEADAGNGEVDPWYDYMRLVNEKIGFAAVARQEKAPSSMLVLGPGSGKEVEEFARRFPACRLTFVEASQNFQVELHRRYPGSTVVAPRHTGQLDLPDASFDVTCAFSVLHHIPNVSRVLEEIGRVSRPDALLLVREPCSSMGDWRYERISTPNERGISKHLLLRMAERAGFTTERTPLPILFEPINKLLKKTIDFDYIPLRGLYYFDLFVSRLVSINDHYWRDTWLKKVGPSSYFYVLRKRGAI